MHRMDLKRRAVLSALVVSTLAATSPAVFGQTDKPVRIIVPLVAGSTVDAVARALAMGLTKATGHSTFVENVGGAGGIPGTSQIVRAPKDGSTLGMISSNHVINPGIYKSIPYDTLKDITPVAVVATVPLVLAVHPSVPAKNLKELIALAKSKPGTLNYGSAGNGSTLHLAGELLRSEADIDLKHVPYRGTGPLITDLIGGQIQMAFVSVSQVAAQIKSGQLRAIGMSTTQRSTALPDVPTLAESGLPKYSFDAWIAVVLPGGTPKSVVDASYASIQTALKAQEMQKTLEGQGLFPLNKGPEESVSFFEKELGKHQRLVKQSGATLD